MVEVHDKAKPLTSWPGTKNKKEKGARSYNLL
jgi:hypothetical protein